MVVSAQAEGASVRIVVSAPVATDNEVTQTVPAAPISHASKRVISSPNVAPDIRSQLRA